MTVYLVGAGPGDPGLLTRRGAELLARADVVLYDRLVSRTVLDLAPAGALLLDVGKDPGGPQARQDEIGRLLVEHGRRAGVVVRLKGGDPFLFGRGGEEVDALTAAGVDWEVVPGVTSAFGVPAALGVPVTHRGLASSVTVVTGRVGDPGTGAPDWAALARAGGTLVILMGMTTRGAIADALMEGGRSPETPVLVVQDGTTPAQRVARTSLAGLAAVELGPPAVIVVGPVAALGAEGASGPLAGRTVVVTRAAPRAQSLVAALEQAGATVVELALTEQVDPADGGAALRAAAGEVHDDAWVVLTSVNAVERFMAVLRDARDLAGVQVAAVGPATAAALSRAGIEADLVPAVHNAQGLVDAFPQATGSASRRVLFPCADLAPDTLGTGLGAKGWEVRRVEAYRTVPRSGPSPDLVARLATADVLILTAPSSVRAFQGLRTPEGGAVPPPPRVVCIGPTTAAAARAVGVPGVVEADDASAEGVVAALVGTLGALGALGALDAGAGDAP